MNTPSTSDLLSLKNRLHELYADGSKHAIYQNVPEFVREALGYREQINENWRSDTPRYRYLVERLHLGSSSTVGDVGANTGYFTLNLAQSRPTWRLHAFEPNPNHRAFIDEVAKAFSLRNVQVHPEPWNAGRLASLGTYDAVLLLNILHHAGFDFDREIPDHNDAFEAYVVTYLSSVRKLTRWLCFQIGSNRGGDKKKPLFAYDNDLARLAWCTQMLSSAGWRIHNVGYAGRSDSGAVEYFDPPETIRTLIQQGAMQDPAISEYLASRRLALFPGEFYRRPLFICEAA